MLPQVLVIYSAYHQMIPYFRGLRKNILLNQRFHLENVGTDNDIDGDGDNEGDNNVNYNDNGNDNYNDFCEIRF